jgi:outer membrane murein-binding lipoprotein Lpp
MLACRQATIVKRRELERVAKLANDDITELKQEISRLKQQQVQTTSQVKTARRELGEAQHQITVWSVCSCDYMPVFHVFGM